MMMEESNSNNHKIFIYNGYIGTTGTTYDSEVTYNQSYPDSVASSAIFLKQGHVLHVEFESAESQAIRLYNVDGSYRTTGYSWNIKFSIDLHIRILANKGINGLKRVYTVDSDGIETDYEIIDMR